jgi:hypothetical protein
MGGHDSGVLIEFPAIILPRAETGNGRERWDRGSMGAHAVDLATDPESASADRPAQGFYPSFFAHFWENPLTSPQAVPGKNTEGFCSQEIPTVDLPEENRFDGRHDECTRVWVVHQNWGCGLESTVVGIGINVHPIVFEKPILL